MADETRRPGDGRIEEGCVMTMTSQIAKDTLAARRFRLIAPLLVLLGLAALIMAPSLIGGFGGGNGGTPHVVTLAPDAPEG
ncbi:MAG TPA: hypothetical protein VHQ91_02765 [Geminicoccaceae bacterium]|jgi:hypothetical protein|nr:hypothetical protein [Geminicoccaceae bacterium]